MNDDDNSIRQQLMGGGTALPSAGGPPTLWIAVGVVAAVAIGAGIFVLSRGKAAVPPPAGPAPVTKAAPAAAKAADEPEPPAAPTDPVGERKTIVVDQLEKALTDARLIGVFEWEGDDVSIRSSFCNESRAEVNSAVPAMKAAGFKTVRCVAPSGAIGFELSL
jgi:hypothetical protein